MYHERSVVGNVPEAVRELVRQDRLTEAAQAAQAAGYFEFAASLYEKMWQLPLARQCAEAGGLWLRALLLALLEPERREVDRLLRRITQEDKATQDTAIAQLSAKREFALAAELALANRDSKLAAEMYEKAGVWVTAARLWQAAGLPGNALAIWQRVLDQSDNQSGETGENEQRALAALELGTIYCDRGEWERGIALLQDATKSPSCRAKAWQIKTKAFHDMGFAHAAATALHEARRYDPALPATVAELLAMSPKRPEHDALVLGRFRLGERIGVGGSAEVFRAVDATTGETVALKRIVASMPQGSPAYERFVREAELGQKLSHPNIVAIWGVFPAAQVVIAELMHSPLAARVNARLPESVVKRIGMDLCGALAFAHARGVIHRDIKPSNIFLDEAGNAKLGDFGAAHLLDLGQTQTGGMIGTLAYMSPEQITGTELTVSADFYSLGTTLFEILTGRTPFLGPDFVAEHLGAPVPSAAGLAQISPAWDVFFNRLLAKAPQERPQSAQEVMELLLAIPLGHAVLPSLGELHAIEASRRRSTSMGVLANRYEMVAEKFGENSVNQSSQRFDTVLHRLVERREMAAEGVAQLIDWAGLGCSRIQRVLTAEIENNVVICESLTGQTLHEWLKMHPTAGRGMAIESCGIACLLEKSGKKHLPLLSAHTVIVDEHGALILKLTEPSQKSAFAMVVDLLALLLPGVEIPSQISNSAQLAAWL